MSVTIRAAGIRVTDRAIQIDLDGERHWLPKSQIESIDGAGLIDAISGWSDDRLHEFVISDWIAQQKGFVLNEERYTTFQLASAVNGFTHVVKDSDDLVCMCKDEKRASIIAAALNLTIGKV